MKRKSKMKNFESEDEEDSDYDETENKKIKIAYSHATRQLNVEKSTKADQDKSDEEEEENEFERQLRLEKEEAERKANEKKLSRIDPDGTEYEYDPIVKGWFPKIPDETFLQYQMNYNANSIYPSADTVYLSNGKFFKWDLDNQKWLDVETAVYNYVDYLTGISYKWNQDKSEWQAQPQSVAGVQTEVVAQQEPITNADKKMNKKADEAGWFEVNEDRNTNVYVKGLPLDMTDDEFEQLMSKYGIITKDIETGKLKVRLYRDEQGELKGDGRACYLMPESVKLCLQLLDGSEFRGHVLHAERAKFEMKGSYDPKKVVKKKNKTKEKKFLEKQRQKLLNWDEKAEIARDKHEKVVVIKGLFSPSDFEKYERLAEKLNDELKSELAHYGEIRKIIIHQRNPEGVVTVSFDSLEDADECCEQLNNRVWKNGRIITCCTWDGKTKYDLEENEEEQNRRLEEWHKYLES